MDAMNRVFYIAILALLLATSIPSFGQQDPQFSQYMFNGLFLNPATAGVDGFTRFQLMHRTQWAGYQTSFDGAGGLSTQMFSLNTPILRLKSGFGFHVVNDNISNFQKNLDMQASYAYHFPVKNGKLSLGIRAGLYSKVIDFTKYRFREEGDPLNFNSKESQIRPDLALGVHYRTEKYYIGLSANHLLKSEFDFGVPPDSTGVSLSNPLASNIYLTGGYDIDLTYQIVFTPSLLVKSDFNTYSVEVSAIATYNQQFWAGLSFRQGDAAIALIGVNLMKDKALRLGYSFDYTVKGQVAKSPMSHEFLVTYTLPQPVPGKKSVTRTPRFRH